MFSIKTIVWLFPIIFMLHDFEEIFFVEAWKKRYKMQLQSTKMKKAPFSDLKDTASFSIAVAIEFLIISALSFFSCIFDWYLLWYGLFFGFTLHLVIHCVLVIQFKNYVPGAVTTIPFLPICIYLLCLSAGYFTFTVNEIVFYCVVGVLGMLLMIYSLHKCMPIFENWIRRFEKQI